MPRGEYGLRRFRELTARGVVRKGRHLGRWSQEAPPLSTQKLRARQAAGCSSPGPARLWGCRLERRREGLGPVRAQTPKCALSCACPACAKDSCFFHVRLFRGHYPPSQASFGTLRPPFPNCSIRGNICSKRPALHVPSVWSANPPRLLCPRDAEVHCV